MRVRAAVLSLVLAALVAAGCGSSSDDPVAAPEPAPPAALGDLDLVVLASASGVRAEADVYGLTLEPLRAYPITQGQRVVGLDATEERLVVAVAGTDGASTLALLAIDGTLRPIPGLGRAVAANPAFAAKRVIVFDEPQSLGVESGTRTVQWNERKRERTVLFKSGDAVLVSDPGANGKLVIAASKGDRAYLVVRSADGDSSEIALTRAARSVAWGKRFVALGFGDAASGSVLVDPGSGNRLTVDGWLPVTWNAGGGLLLISKPGAAGSELALLNPNRSEAPNRLGVLADLSVYEGAWVRGAGR